MNLSDQIRSVYNEAYIGLYHKLLKVKKLELQREQFIIDDLVLKVDPLAVFLQYLDENSALKINPIKNNEFVISWESRDDYCVFAVPDEFFDDFPSYISKYEQEVKEHNNKEKERYKNFLEKKKEQQK
nr:MAG TPA: hypothetical protein [Caudoviricetes sp.]